MTGMHRALTYISAHVEVSAGLPIEAQLDPETGLLRLRLGRAYPVTLSVDRYGLSRLRTVPGPERGLDDRLGRRA